MKRRSRLDQEFFVTGGDVNRHAGDRTAGRAVGRLDDVLEEGDEVLEYLAGPVATGLARI